MKRILVIHPSRPVRETVALFLAGSYEVARRFATLDGAALAEAASSVDLVIASARPATRTVELARLAAGGNLAVLLLADSEAAAKSLPSGGNIGVLVKPFSPYDLKTKIANLFNRSLLEAPASARAAPEIMRGSCLEYPFMSRATARLAHRFATFSLPVLIWGELGCGQDRVARAIYSNTAGAGPLLQLNGAAVSADYLKDKSIALGGGQDAGGAPLVAVIEKLDRLSPSGQSMLVDFLERFEGTHGRLRLLATANADLLERVYRGEFLERLYYRLATLTLPLAPLRERRADIPVLARWFASFYAVDVGVEKVSFTAAALDRLSDYLWFGNVNEFETVIARTLAIHGKPRIDAPDLVFDVAAFRDAAPIGDRDETIAPARTGEPTPSATVHSPAVNFKSDDASPLKGTIGSSSDLRLLVHELAHELKNPMVTIKTFAQLLADRYDDAGFRERFQDVVDGDIERMDDLLDVMMEFAGFDRPHKSRIVLKQRLHSTLRDIHDDCAKRQVRVGWKGNGEGGTINADEAQVQYALKNTLLTVLAQTKTGSEIELAVNPQGGLTISYLREGEKIKSLVNYFNQAPAQGEEGILPLRILLAREIVERNGGRIDMDQSDGGREIVTVEFPVG